MIKITLPDGAVRSYNKGVSSLDVEANRVIEQRINHEFQKFFM